VRFRNLLSELSGERIVILSTHIVSDVEAVATRIALIAHGRLLADAAPEALLREAEGRVWELVVAADALPALRTRHRIAGQMRRSDGVQVRIVADAPPAPGARPVTPSLEDAYLLHMDRARAEEAAK
jgi:ABC-type multidrug transport system ATPase subunit